MSRRVWITVGLSAVAVAFAVRFGLTFPWSQTVDALADCDWLLLAAASAVNLVSLAAKAGAWYLLLRPFAPLRMSTAQSATFVGAAVNCVSISVSGEAARMQLARSRDGVSFKDAAISLVGSRVVEAVGLVVFMAGALVVLSPWPGARLIGYGLVALVATLVLGYRAVPWNRLHASAVGRWHETFMQLPGSITRGSLVGAIMLTVCNWIAQWVTYHWTIAATHIDVTPAVSLSTLVMANVAGILRLTPGNIGLLQGSLVLSMRAFDIPAASALAAGLALQAVQTIPVLALGIAIVGRQGFRQIATRRVEAA